MKKNMVLTGVLPKRFFGLFFLAFFILAAPEPRAEKIHIVKRGESLSSIAQKYRVTISRIQGANDMEDTRLQIGQSLIIPNPSPEASNPSSPRKGNLTSSSQDEDIPDPHVIKSGDTLSAIAKRYCLTAKELRALNGLNGRRLQIGQVLQLKQEEELSEEGKIQSGEGSYGAALASNDGSAIPISQGADAIEETVAESFLGVKYRRGGTNVKTGLDCSAYVQKVFRMVGTDLPRTAREQFGVGREVARDALRAGDLVFFKRSQAKRPAHVGLYIGNDRFIHSSTTKRKIRVDSLNTRYFSTRFIGGRRIQEIKEPPRVPQPEMSYSQASLQAFERALSISFLPAANQPTPSHSPDL